MFTLSSFFPELPSEEAILRRRQNPARADAEQLCRSMVQRLVDAIRPAPSDPVVRRRPGRPLGSFDVAFFCGRLVQNMVEDAMKSSQSESTPAKPKKVYKSWSETERAVALDLAIEKGSDGSVVSMLRTIFPKAFGSIRESLLRYFRIMEQRQKEGKPKYKRDSMISSLALQDVVACITSYVEAKLEFTTEEIRCLVVPLLEERHPLVIAGGFTASINRLNVLMREHMKLPMRRVGTECYAKGTVR